MDNPIKARTEGPADTRKDITMKQVTFDWMLSHASEKDGTGLEPVVASVPGAVQLDYAKAKNYPPYYFGLNFKQFDWTEDEYFFYDTTLDFTCQADEHAILCFDGIDYRYEITLDGTLVAKGEGAFTPVKLDVTAYAGKKTALRVTIFPIPKRYPAQNRAQASACCKPPSSYTWDWHPRLVPSGIWQGAHLDIVAAGAPRDLEATYRLSDDLKSVTVNAQVKVYGDGALKAELIAPDGKTVVASQEKTAKDGELTSFTLTLESPELWFPRGYGAQPRYTLRVSGSEVVERKIGFRRSKLILNEGAERVFQWGFPLGPLCAPMQIQINGVKVFAKGSNWVNTEIFPCLATPERYDELIKLAYDANMNIFRMWGGQYINHDYFYDKCDELGIMIWQEFMLSCNLYPDDDNYLDVLTQEAISIIRMLRTHPCLTFWCGGNELFNSWSGLTVQSHPLRLLDKLCYEHDRFTPFNMTSPLHGVRHGSYVKVVFPEHERREGNFSNGHEFIVDVKKCQATGYTEFGCNGGSRKEYLLKYVMDEQTYEDCNGENEIWRSHHAFKSWNESTWLGLPDVHYFFGGHKSVDDLIDKSIYLQDMCYKTMFEEMRRQAPLCSMAINWDYNEPWPCAAGNSLVNWPAEPKSALNAVGEALRPTLLSLELPHNRYLTGDTLNGTLWVLNDNADEAPAANAEVYLINGESKTKLADISTEAVAARKNGKFGSFELTIPADLPERFAISLECAEHPEWNSTYSLAHNVTIKTGNEYVDAGKSEFADF